VIRHLLCRFDVSRIPETWKCLPAQFLNPKRLERSEALKRLEPLERIDPLDDGAKRLSVLNGVNGPVP
jgi:hypothetical protein